MATKEELGYTVVIGFDYGVVTLKPGDIQQLYFIEDIFSYCMVGKMVIDDRYGFVEYGPFTGNERLLLAYGTENTRRILFDIIKIEKITMSSPTIPDKGFQLAIYFVDTTYKYFTKRRFSRSWKKTEYNNNYNILKHILEKWCEGGENEKILVRRYDETKTKSEFISPYWTPIECISWLNKHTKPSPSNAIGNELGGYLYYNNTYWDYTESKNKDNNFTAAWMSINNLFGYPTNKKDDFIDFDNPYIFSGSPPNKKESGDKLNKDSPTYVNKILDWKLGGIDFINTKRIQGGHMLGYNFDGKLLKDRTYKYTKKNDTENVDKGVVDQTTGLGLVSLFPDISERDSEIFLNNINTNDELDTLYFHDWLRTYSRQQSLSVIVRGWEERFAGMMIKDVIWRGFDKEVSPYNKNLLGSYLIKSVTHNFGSKQGYTQKLVLLKNAYYKSDNESLIDMGITNISTGNTIIKGA